MSSLGDVYRVYVKPSLDGLMVVRKKTTRHVSARVAASKERIRKYSETVKPPAREAHEALVAAGKCPTKRVYKPGVGYEERPVCPIKLMKSELRKAMKRAHGAG